MISAILRLLAVHVATRFTEKRLKADALTPGTPAMGQESWLLSYSVLYRVLWSLMVVLWAAAVGLMAVVFMQGQLAWRLLPAIPLFGGALAFSVFAAKAGFTQELEVSSWGITKRRSGAVVAAVPWPDVARLEFVSYLDSYRVVPRQGPSIRFSMHIQGLPRFKWLARSHAPAEALARIQARISTLGRL
jgi:hypothetical protein